MVRVRPNPTEEFEGRIFHNRRILHDGKTILPTELRRSLHNAVNHHNGTMNHDGQFVTEWTSHIRPPFLHLSGYLDMIVFGHVLSMRDFQFSRLLHNGSITHRIRHQHNGELVHDGQTRGVLIARHNGRSPYSINDTFHAPTMNLQMADGFPTVEASAVNVGIFDGEAFRRPTYFDGTYRHDGRIISTGGPIDTLSLLHGLPMQDAPAASFRHDGLLRHDGTENHDGIRDVFALENNVTGLGVWCAENMEAKESVTPEGMTLGDAEDFRRPIYFDGTYRHNRAIINTGGVTDKQTFSQELSMRDTAAGFFRHDGLLWHDGREPHSGIGDTFAREKHDVGIGLKFADNMEPGENYDYDLEMGSFILEPFSKLYSHDGRQSHNGRIIHSNFVCDRFASGSKLAPFEDSAKGTLRHMGILRHDGTEKHSLTGKEPAYETFTVGFRYHRYHNGAYLFDRGIKHNANTLFPLEDIA